MNKFFEELIDILAEIIEVIEEGCENEDLFCAHVKRNELTELIISEECSLSKKIGKIVKFNLDDLFNMDILITVAIKEEPSDLIIEMSDTPKIKEFLTREHKDAIIDLI